MLDMMKILVIINVQKQPPEQRCSVVKKAVLRNFTKFTGKRLSASLFFNKVAGIRPATLLKKRLWHRYFAVKFLRTPFLQNTLDDCFCSERQPHLTVRTTNPFRQLFPKGEDLPVQDFRKRKIFPNGKIKDLYQKALKNEAVSFWGK